MGALMLTRALLVLLAMMTGLAAGPAQASSRAPQSAVSFSIESGCIASARAEARVAAHAHLALGFPVVKPVQKPRSGCELTVARTVEHGDRSRE